ncbi:phosphoglycerol transferase alkaline phosphatase superfamily protein [Secundilactobacillus odoratitofui DSM 19909 = JCM 15043]|uniref:Phosphoglycerol transferase alkaline phosphatase superfamily protein n=1 Tax=Secundilactobacillus odoratitofui DSM 19909 = JCM 15043 TaxID=1423776 RepID=A0A0R1M4V7_9LACO|nr:LTA synthase family protein [Secundilactobacillus odoratitofui]KRK99394.1 phosphoglycerol transferase alkaline phosphatase superfamily protein [Secundilactobacillus odoratitofui DSM 19909 = JCM 15043]
MSDFVKRTAAKLNTVFGFFLLVVVLFCIKTYIAYQLEFTLGVKGGVQEFLLAVNPIPAALLLFGIALYFRGRLVYWLMLIIDVIQTTWLFANIIYYREFSDFLSFGIIKGSGNVQNNLGKSIGQIIHPSDFFVYLDIILLIVLLLTHVIRIDGRPFKRRFAFTMTILSFALMGAEYGMANADRSGLLTRTFDNNYLVKYLGLNEYAAFSVYQTQKQSATRAHANASDLKSVEKYLKHNRVAANATTFGTQKGKNVIIIHLESFQQYLINYKVDGKEVTPNLNKFYKNQNTMSFDNFYNQVAQGKTSDAEMMLENSLFGLPQGSAMTEYGTQNTFQAAPALLDQDGYTSAAFHGDVPSFWNRDNTYKSWGYDYFFSSQYYKEKSDYTVGYGLKDKIFFRDSAKYLQELPQPFYAKLITLTNHYPYELDKQNTDFPATKTGDKTVDPYVQTAHYLDEAFGEFITYLKEAGLYKNSMIVLYGDHYGISNNHRAAIAQLLGKDKVTSYDLAQFQKVPFMIHATGLKGGINHTYGGEIDVLPTLLDLLGVKNTNTIQFGNDLLAKNRNQTVAFRNGDFITPQFTKVGSTVYNTKSGDVIKPTTKQKATLAKEQNRVTTELSLSDRVIQGDLLRFYQLKDFKSVDKKKYNYKYSNGMEQLEKAQKSEPTSVKAKNGGKNTATYKTDAPELK